MPVVEPTIRCQIISFLLDVDLYSYIPQALRFDYILCSFSEPEPVCQLCNADDDERPKQLSTAASIQAHYFMVVLKGKAHYQRGYSNRYRGYKLVNRN